MYFCTSSTSPPPSPHQYDDSSHLTLKESSSTKAYTTQVGRRELNKLEDAKLNFPTYLFHNLHLGLWIIRAVYKKTFFFFISEGICAKREVRLMRNNLRQVHRQIEMTATTALHQQFCSVRRSMLSNMKF